MKRFGIIKKTPLRLLFGGALIIASWLLFMLNFKFSIEFTGGVEAQLDVLISDEQKLKKDITKSLEDKKIEDVAVYVNTKEGKTDLLITANMDKDSVPTLISDTIKSSLVSKKYIQSENNIASLYTNGPSISKYMKSTALIAIFTGIGLIVIYMFFSFGAIRKVIPPVYLIIITIITMLFDVSVTAGGYGLAMMINPTLQVDSIFIIVLLTVMGYSINDTIIVLDRIRENSKNETDGLKKGKVLYGKVFEDSLRQTMRRSIGTSLSTLIVVVVMFIFGNVTMQHFSYTMGIGIICGTYSSLFIAAPAIYLATGKYRKERKKL